MNEDQIKLLRKIAKKKSIKDMVIALIAMLDEEEAEEYIQTLEDL